jgi:hypothetical protein
VEVIVVTDRLDGLERALELCAAVLDPDPDAVGRVSP